MPDNRFIKPLKGDNAFAKKRPLKPETVQNKVLDFLESLESKLSTIASNTAEYKQLQDMIAVLKAYKLPESLSVSNFPPEMTGKKPLGVNVANWPKALTDGSFGAKSEPKLIRDDKAEKFLSNALAEFKKVSGLFGNVLTFKSPFHQQDKNALAVKWQAEQWKKLIQAIDGSSNGSFDAAMNAALATINTNIATLSANNALLVAGLVGRCIAPLTGTATANGDTTIVTPATGKKLRVYVYEANNGGSADITVLFKLGTLSFGKKLLAKNGGLMTVSLVQNYYEAPLANDLLKINLSAGSATVSWSVGTIEV